MRKLWIIPAFFVVSHLGAAEEVKASHILVKTQDEADLIRNEIIEKGGTKAAFMEAARKYSKDVNTKRAGGALGWFTRQKMVHEFSDAAFDLKTGDVSTPVKSQYGFHLILLEDRREMTPFQPPPPPPPPPNPAPVPAGAHPGTTAETPAQPVKAPAAGPADLAPSSPTPAAPATPAQPTAQTPVPPAEAPKVEPKRPALPERALKMSIDIKEKLLLPTQTVEVDLTLTNSGQGPMKVFSQDLWPLGFGVAGEVAPLAPPAVWDALKAKKPESPIVTLGSRASMGASFTLNDWFKDLPPAGRYRLAWRPQTFFQNLETVFPEIAALPDAVAIKAVCTDPKVFARDVAGQPLRLQYRNFDREVIFTIFDPINPAAGKKYYASVEFDRGTVWFELFADRQTEGVRQFARLAQTGFYDWLSLFDIQKGNYLRGGSPTENDFGGPEQFVAVQNLQKITHEKGTLSLVSRTSRSGKEVGSIFFISRKAHPEWDEDHIPIGKVISGEDVLERIDSSPGRVGIRKINILTADKLPQEVAGGAASALTESKEPGRVQPVVKIKTSKGEFSMELFEDDAPRTVANFIELSEKGIYNPDPNKQQDKELTFYYAVPGTLLLTGSPTNDDRGGPGYRIASETDGNKKTHVKGTLTMLLETDPVSKNPVPDSAGSQFMICLQDIPAWNGLYTPFGKVTEGMDVVEKLVQGDKIDSVTVVSKRNHPYKAQTLPLGR